MWCTQCPTSESLSGISPDTRPRLMGFHVWPLSSLRNAPAEEIAAMIRGPCRMRVCRHSPPAPGGQVTDDGCVRSPLSSVQVVPPSDDLYRAASSAPA